MNRLMVLVTSFTLALVFSASAAADAKAVDPAIALKNLPAPEMPARAAALVKSATKIEREARTVQVVKAAVAINPASAPSIVGAIAREVPASAATAAAVAAAYQPAQASAIAQAAASAAPEQAAAIVVKVCRVVPNQYRNVAVAVARAVPQSSRQILEAVAIALPELKDSMEKALAGYSGGMSVASALEKVAPANPTASVQPDGMFTGFRGPAGSPPGVLLSGTATNSNPATSGEQPPGGRNYAAP